MLPVLNRVVHRLGRWYIQRIVKSEWESQNPKRLNERAVEYGFVFNCLAQLAPPAVLDVGTGKTALPSLLKSCGYHVTAVDNIRDYWPQGMFNRHFHVLDDDIADSKVRQRFDVVLCISVLEHVREYKLALATMASLTKPGGHMIITCPYSESIGSPNCYEEIDSYGKENPYICRQFTRMDFSEWLNSSGASIVKQERWRFFKSEFWSCGSQIQPPEKVLPEQPHQHTCMLIRIPE